VSNWQFEWITSWDEIWRYEFLNKWRDIIDSSPDAHVFFEPSLVKAWVETYIRLENIHPRFLIGHFGNEIIIFMPLVYVKKGWKNACQHTMLPVGYSEFDYHDPIVMGCPDSEILNSFWKELFVAIFSKWGRSLDVLAISRLRSSVTEGDFKVSQSECAPFINLKGINSSGELLGTLSQSLRGDIKRQKKRLENIGEIKLRVFSKDETAEALNILPSIISEHTRRWPRSYKAPGFHKSLVINCLNTGIMHMSELLVAGEPISWHIGFLHRSRYYWYMPVYRSEYQQYSPGKLHLYMCVEEALKKGVAIFDLLRGDEDYKRQWAKESINLFNLRWNSKSVLSSVKAFLLNSIKSNISSLLKGIQDSCHSIRMRNY
jgi:CelD/BcsL family acetyltransferase involved in cellulose biosynthesis